MLDRQIYLNGMTGSGKSGLGRRAARDLGLPFTDLDQWIEEKSGMTIPEIFDQYGEAGFRRAETGALISLTRSRPGLIALGGGTAMTAENRKIMQAWGSVMTLKTLFEIRMPLYRKLADVTIPNDGEYDRTLMLLERVLKERYHA